MFAKLIVDIANTNVDRLFTYSVPDEINLKEGHRVLAPFGRSNRPTEGFVLQLTEETHSGLFP